MLHPKQVFLLYKIKALKVLDEATVSSSVSHNVILFQAIYIPAYRDVSS